MDEWVRREKEKEDEWVRIGNVRDIANETIRARTWKDTVSEVAHQTLPPAAAAITGTPTFFGTKSPSAAATVGGAAYMGTESALDLVDRNILGINDRPVPTDLKDAAWDQAKRSAGDFGVGFSQTALGNRFGSNLSPLAAMEEKANQAMGFRTAPRVTGWAEDVAKGVLAPYSDTLTPERLAHVKELGDMGYNVSPGAMTGSRLWSIIERWGRRVPGSAGAFQDVDRANLLALIERRNSLLGMGDSGVELANLNRMINERAEEMLASQQGASRARVEGVRTMIKRTLGAGRRVEGEVKRFLLSAKDASDELMLRKNAAYQAVDRFIPSLDDSGAPINRLTADSNLAGVARDILRQEGDLPAMKDSALVKAAREIIDATSPTPPPDIPASRAGVPLWRIPGSENYSQTPPPRPPMTWETLQTLKARFSDAVNDPMRGGMAPGAKGQVTSVGRQWARLSEAVDEDMGAIASSVSEEARGAWDAAKALNKQYKQKFGPEADFWRSLNENNSPKRLFGIAEIVFENMETRRQAIELGGEDAVRRLERAYTSALLQEATGSAGGFDPKKFLGIVDRQDQAMLAAMWGRDGLQAVKNAMRGAVDAEKIPKSIWSSLTKEDAVKMLLDTNRPHRLKGVIRQLDPETVDGLRGQFLIMTLGGEGAIGTKAKTLGLPNEIKIGAVTGNMKAADELGKVLFPADDLARLRSFREALRLLQDYYGQGFDPGSGVHLTTSQEVGGMVPGSPFSKEGWFVHAGKKVGEFATRWVLVKGYYSQLLKDWVTRRVVSPEQAAEWGNLLSKYIGQPAIAAATGVKYTKMRGEIPVREEKDEFVKVPSTGATKKTESQKLDDYVGGYRPQVWGSDRPMSQDELLEWQRQMEGEDDYYR